MPRRKPPTPPPDKIYADRLESLLGAVWGAAMDGCVGAVGEARRILAQQAVFHGFGAQAAPPVHTKVETADELAVYRARYAGGDWAHPRGKDGTPQ